MSQVNYPRPVERGSLMLRFQRNTKYMDPGSHGGGDTGRAAGTREGRLGDGGYTGMEAGRLRVHGRGGGKVAGTRAGRARRWRAHGRHTGIREWP